MILAGTGVNGPPLPRNAPRRRPRQHWQLAEPHPVESAALAASARLPQVLAELLVARGIAPAILPLLAEKYKAEQVELRGDDESRAILAGYPQLKAAVEEDWSTEYLAPILSVRVVDGVDQAIEHINRYSSQHTDAIVTEDYTRAMRFLREVDSASVMVNASTRFADGFEFGLGAEIGISNDKLHARGPVGLEGLTSQKYVVLGQGQVRQ